MSGSSPDPVANICHSCRQAQLTMIALLTVHLTTVLGQVKSSHMREHRDPDWSFGCGRDRIVLISGIESKEIFVYQSQIGAARNFGLEVFVAIKAMPLYL